MRRYFSIAQELELVDEFCLEINENYGRNYGRRIRRDIRLFGKVFHSFFNESFLNQVHSTEWVVHWLRKYQRKPVYQKQLLTMAWRFCSWLFERRITSDNVIVFHGRNRPPAGKEEALVLPEGLHLVYSEYQPPGALAVFTVQRYRKAIGEYIRLVAQQPGSGKFSLDEAFEERLVNRWIRCVSHNHSFSTTFLWVSCLSRFMDHLVSIKRIHCNPIRTMMGRHGCIQSRLLKATTAADPEAELAKLKKPPCFQSELSRELYNYIEWKKQTGRKVSNFQSCLRPFDAFLISRQGAVPITGGLIGEYAESMTHLAPATRANRLTILRGFCSYMKRVDPKIFTVSAAGITGPRVISRTPYIIMPELFLKIIEQVKVDCRNARCRLTEKAVVVVLELLYATGLRVGEASRLTRQAVDLQEGTLCVRETKFNKSRIVPVSDSLRRMLANFAVLRDSSSEIRDPGVLFFPTTRGLSVKTPYVRRRFKSAVREVFRAEGMGGNYPRVHDLRHSFAVRSLLRWYNQGHDVQNKLPVLATYLGHVGIASTQTYITATSQLLDAASSRFQTHAGDVINPNLKDTEI